MKILLDACAWFAATDSPEGGAGRILDMATDRALFRIVISPTIFRQAGRNIRNKAHSEALTRFREAILSTMVRFIPDPDESEMDKWREFVVSEDLIIVAAAMKAKVDGLVTLDSAHLLSEVVKSRVSVPIHTPGSFLKWWKVRKKTG